MQATFTHALPCPAEKAWSQFLSPEHLKKISYPLVTFGHRDAVPVRWAKGDCATFRLSLFGMIPFSAHTIRIADVDSDRMWLMTEEAGGLIRSWSHRFAVDRISANACLCRDVIQIDAGVLTPFVWFYAQLYYRYRYFRWRRLL